MGKERSYDPLHHDAEKRYDPSLSQVMCCIGVLLLFLFVGLGVGVMIGYFVFGSAKASTGCSKGVTESTQFQWGAVLNDDGKVVSALDKGAEQMKASNIETNLK